MCPTFVRAWMTAMHISRYVFQWVCGATVVWCLTGYARAQELPVVSNTTLDAQTVARMWHFIKSKTDAPADLAIPPIVVDESLPKNVRLMFEYPSQHAPEAAMRIRLNPRNMVAWNNGMWHWALGHEMTHYAFLLRENGWQQKVWYENRLKHHCDYEFMTITQNIAELLWEIYESSEDRLHMYLEANKSCRHQPNQ
jgi:hypothetical protein